MNGEWTGTKLPTMLFTPGQRIQLTTHRLYSQMHDLINEHCNDLAKTMTIEQGKPLKEAIGEIGNEVIEQVGFARGITDLTTYAYLCDVFILPDYRKLGLSKWLMDIITNHSELRGVRRFMLATNDAHSLYNQYGFEQIDNPELFMHKVRKAPYQQ